MKKILILASAALAVFAACSKEVDKTPAEKGQGEKKTVSFIAELDATKATETNAVFSWKMNDAVAVVDKDDDAVNYFYCTTEDNAAIGKFTGTHSGEFAYAIAPFSAAKMMEHVSDGTDEVIDYTITLPGTYTDYIPGTTNAVMVGTPNGTDKFLFRHAAALLKFTVANVPVGTKSFWLKTNKKISGEYTFSKVTGVEISETSTEETEVTLVLKDEVTTANTTLDFYIPVPTGKYTNFIVTLYNESLDELASVSKSGLNITLNRGDVYYTPTITLDAAPELEDKVFFEERFSEADGLAGWSGNVASASFKADNDGWDATASYSGDEAARFGSSSKNGNAKTPAISIPLEYRGETLNLSFKAGAWSGKGTSLGISADGATLSESSVTLLDSQWKDYTLSISNITKSSITISFSKSDQWFLDDVCVYYGEKPVEKEKPGLTFANDNVKAVLGASSFEAPVLTNDKNVPITWESSNPEVADFEGDNLVIKAAGTTTISAIFAGNDQYAAQTVTYTLIVEEASLEVSSVKPSNVPSQANSTATFTVTSNVPWTASSDSDYISSIEPSSEQVASDNPVTVTVTFKANSGTIRTAIINVKPSDQTHFSSLNKTVEITQNEKSTVDILNYDWAGITGTSYNTATQNGSVSKAQYSINAAGGNESIQLRTNSNSGIVTTKSGGILKKITVKWNNNTANERVLDVYAKNSAYDSPSDLYSDTKQGTKITSFAKANGDGSYTFSTDYEFIGIRSASGALYLDEVDIEWDETSWSLSKIEVTKAPNKTAYIAGESFVPDGMEVTATYVDDSDDSHTKTKVVTGYTYNPSDALKESDNTVTISYKEGDVTKTATVDISVSPKPTLNAELSVSGLPTEFNVGDSFSFGEGTVKAVYSDNSEKELSINDVTIEGFDSTEEATGQEVTIKYTEDGLTATAMVTVNIVDSGEEAPKSVSYDFTGSDWTVSEGVLSNGTVSFSGQGGANFKMNDGYFFMGKSGAYLNFPKYSYPVTKIVITGKSGASGSVKQNIYVGNNAVSTETTGATGTNTYNIASGSQTAGTVYTLKVTSAHNTQITKIEVFFGSSN